MTSGIVVVPLVFIIGLGMLIFWNKRRCAGKILCFFLSGDTHMKPSLCEYADDFVFYGNKAYDLYPSRCRWTRFPSGWPNFLQEVVPCALYESGNAVPLDWTNPPEQHDLKLRSMNIKTCLEENVVRKLAQEAAAQGGPVGGFRINWRRVWPILLIVGGIIGFIVFRSGILARLI